MDSFFNIIINAPAYVQIVALIVACLACKFGPRNLFSFSGRLSRSSYIACMIFLLIIGFITIFVFGFYQNNRSDLLLTLSAALYILVIIINLSIVIRRLHDIGFSPWWIAVLIFASVSALEYYPDTNLVNLATNILTAILLLIPGTQGRNKYGPDPLAKDEAAEK